MRKTAAFAALAVLTVLCPAISRGEENAPPVSAKARIERTAFFVGDVLDFKMDIYYRPEFVVVEEDLNPKTVNLAPFEVISGEIKRSTFGKFLVLNCSYKIRSFELGKTERNLDVTLRYLAAADKDLGEKAMREVKLSIPVEWRTTLPKGVDDIRDFVGVVKHPYRSTAFFVAAFLVLFVYARRTLKRVLVVKTEKTGDFGTKSLVKMARLTRKKIKKILWNSDGNWAATEKLIFGEVYVFVLTALSLKKETGRTASELKILAGGLNEAIYYKKSILGLVEFLGLIENSRWRGELVLEDFIVKTDSAFAALGNFTYWHMAVNFILRRFKK